MVSGESEREREREREKDKILTVIGIVSTKLVFQLEYVVVIIKLLTVQTKGSNTQFSTPLYLPPGQKSTAH